MRGHFHYNDGLVSLSQCFPEEIYDTLEYSQVKAIAVSMRLRSKIYRLRTANKLSGAIAEEAPS